MNHIRLISLAVCLFLETIGGISSMALADVASEADAKAERHFEKANELRKVADYNGAITEYEKAISASPKSEFAWNARYWIGQCHLQAGRHDAALSAFQTVLDEYPTSKIIASTKRMIERTEQAKDASLFLKAVKKGDIERIKELISQGADVNAKDNRGMTPLHQAAFYGQREVAKVLIVRGANVNETDTAGQTPLHIAANFGAKFIPELLLANGASISARDKAGNTPLHAATYFWNCQKDLLELLIAKGSDVQARNKVGQTPLHRVCMIRRRHRRLYIPAEVLLAHGAKVDAKDKSGNTPIHFAVKNGHGKLIDLLQAKGAIISKDYKPDNDTLLDMAWRNDAYHLELLLDYGADVNTAGRKGFSLLHYAADNGNANMTRMLLDNGANPNIVERGSGQTPLHRAALDNKKTVAEMLHAHGADMNARDWYGKTPLSLAKEGGHTEIIELLRKHGAKE